MTKDNNELPGFRDKLQAAAELLEAIAADRGLLARVAEEESTRLLKAAGEISRPDARARRQLVKAATRRRKAERTERAESALNETGIRKLRRQSVFPRRWPGRAAPPTPPLRAPRTRSRTAISARPTTPSCTIFTTSSARPAPRLISASAPKRPT